MTKPDAPNLPASRSPLTTLEPFLARLGERYADFAGRNELAPAGKPASLTLADAALRDLVALERYPGRPAQVAVIGPTQAGKSTVVNLLLGHQATEVSPLAGFTRQPQGFAIGADTGNHRWLETAFPTRSRREPRQLGKDDSDCYGFTVLQDSTASATLPANTVVWDTPDFDSLAARAYRDSMFEVIAIADLIVLVLSKEKYADLSVWELLKLIHPLQRPILVCLNKVTVDAQQALGAALRKKLSTLGLSEDEAPVVCLPMQAGIHELNDSELPPQVKTLRASVRQRAGRIDTHVRSHGARRLLENHWSDWIKPIVAEHQALERWQTLSTEAIQQALAAYRRDYLNHEKRYDTFRRAVAQLLTLLELPGLAKPLTSVRRAVTWPWRQFSAAYRRGTAGPKGDIDNEIAVLESTLDHLLTSLQQELLQSRVGSDQARAVFAALDERMSNERPALKMQFMTAVDQYRADFEPEVEAAAQRLYEILQNKPAVLNTLRAARVTTDAAGIAFALQTGGVGINDLLFAPAMLSLTSMLTEGALGSYMSVVENNLKKRQLAAVAVQVFDDVVSPALDELPQGLAGAGLIAISKNELKAAEQALEDWQRGSPHIAPGRYEA